MNLFIKRCELALKSISTRTRILCFATALIPPLAIAVYAIILPIIKTPDLQECEICSKQTDTSIADKLHELQCDKYFLLQQINMAMQSDSVGLIVNLKDSMVNLSVRGCIVHSCSLLAFSIKGEFHPSPQPYLLENEIATIVKLPIKIKKAPSDTNEAQSRQDGKPTPHKKNDVKVMYQFVNDISLEFIQGEPFSFKSVPNRLRYNAIINAKNAIETIKSAVRLDIPKQKMVISIFIPQNDAIAIYRATPSRLKLAIRPN